MAFNQTSPADLAAIPSRSRSTSVAGAATNARAALLALVTNRSQSRAQELGIDTPRLMRVTAIAGARLPDQP